MPKKGKKKDDWPEDNDVDSLSSKVASTTLDDEQSTPAKASKKKSKKMAMLADLAAERESTVSLTTSASVACALSCYECARNDGFFSILTEWRK